MKLQKLVYFAHGWSLAVDDRPLIDDTIEAWRYGPVIPTLYHEFKEFGSGPITGRAVFLKFGRGNKITFEGPEVENVSDLELLQRVWETYGKLSGIQLSNMTHAPGTPWEKAWSENHGRKHVDMSNELIKQYFVAQLNAVA